MATKAFIGIVDTSCINEFNDGNGVLIRCWKLGLLLSEDKGIVFNIGIDDPNYPHVSGLPIGARIKVIAESRINNDGRVKWKLAQIETVGVE